MFLTEKLSISNNVKEYADKIADKIEDDALKLFNRNQIYYSPITNTCYVSNNIIVDTLELSDSKMPLSIKVDYIIYDVADVKEYNELVTQENGEFLNSESDYKSSYIKIVSAYIGNELITNFYENIYHEVEHMFQYAQGMQKKVDLYDSVINLYNSKDKDESNVGYSLYFTFKHEQDAMTHQFYAMIREYNLNIKDFDYFLNKSEYKHAIDSLKIVKQINKEKLKVILNKIGFSIADYNKRIHYSYKRFKQKLYNAFKYSLYESNERNKKIILMYNFGKEIIYESQIKKYNFKPLIKIENIFNYV